MHPIHHCLIAAEPTPLERIERVVSHPQAIAQCARFLRERLPSAEHVSAPSTADAVGVARGRRAQRPRRSARAWRPSSTAGELIAADVEDHPDNATRFVWLAPAAEAAEPDGAAKTTIVFWGAGDEAPGWLVDVLGELSSREVNLTRIESRPRRIRLGHYMFFADLDGPAVRARRCAKPSRRSARTSRRFACSARTARSPPDRTAAGGSRPRTARWHLAGPGRGGAG